MISVNGNQKLFSPPKSLPEGHVIRVLYNEHRIILGYLNELDDIRQKIFELDTPIDHPELFVKMIHILEHLNQVDKHHQREEQILFPVLETTTASVHLQVLASEHHFLKNYKQKFLDHVRDLAGMDFKSYKLQMNYMANGIIGILREHIFLENNSVFPQALKAITDPEKWDNIRQEFDKIGYYFVKEMLK
jgi:DUF438 domain-containing protein